MYIIGFNNGGLSSDVRGLLVSKVRYHLLIIYVDA